MYIIVFRSWNTPRKVLFSEVNQSITASFYFGAKKLAAIAIAPQDFLAIQEVAEKWLGDMRMSSSCVPGSNQPAPIIRWEN